MDIPRELVYEDKKKLSLFGIDNKSYVNQKLYDEWMLMRTELIPEKGCLAIMHLKSFNDAYYLCTLALKHQVNIDFIMYSIERINMPSVVLPMVHFYLFCVKMPNTDVSRYLKLIETFSKKEGWDKNLQDIKKLEDDFKKKIDDSMFEPRKITSELLSSIKWWKITNQFKKKDIETLIRYIGKTQDEQKLIAKSIKEAAEDYEWNYNCDLQSYEGIDEDGNLCFFEDKPLDLSEVRQYCNNIISGNEIIPLIKATSLNESKASVKINLQHFLLETWFDTFCANKDKFTNEWRHKLIVDLMATKWGDEIAVQWYANNTKKIPKIKMALVGALVKAEVLKGKYDDLCACFNFEKVKRRSMADYMSKNEFRPYLNWLKEYVKR